MSKATYKEFNYEHSKGWYPDRACEFMSKIGKERIIGVTSQNDSNASSVTVWYWKDSAAPGE